MLSIFIQSFAWFIFNSYLNFHLSRNKISLKFQIFWICLPTSTIMWIQRNILYITYIWYDWFSLFTSLPISGLFPVLIVVFFYYNFWSLRRVRKESLCISDLLLRKVNGINYWVAQWLRMDFSSFTIYYCLALRVYWPEKHLTMFTFSRYLGESGERGKRGETQAWVR